MCLWYQSFDTYIDWEYSAASPPLPCELLFCFLKRVFQRIQVVNLFLYALKFSLLFLKIFFEMKRESWPYCLLETVLCCSGTGFEQPRRWILYWILRNCRVQGLVNFQSPKCVDIIWRSDTLGETLADWLALRDVFIEVCLFFGWLIFRIKGLS